jgi:adenylate cyclase
MIDGLRERCGSCTPAEIRAELSRVLESPKFEASKRNRRFLTYIVEETLAGRADRIKAYSIGTDVFGRNENFDAQLDTIVRIEARRLRTSLDHFYLKDYTASSLQITVPKGGYVPDFKKISALDTASAGDTQISLNLPIVRRRHTSVAVLLFDAEGDRSVFINFNRGFTDQIAIGLSNYPGLSTVCLVADLWDAQATAGTHLRLDPGAELVLTGSTALFEGMLNVKALLVHARTGRVIWGRTFERRLEPGTILTMRDEIANAIVRAVAEPHDVIGSWMPGLANGKTPSPSIVSELIPCLNKC